MLEAHTVDQTHLASLLTQVKLGDAASFTNFAEEVIPRLHRFVAAHRLPSDDCEDVVQEALIKLWKNVHTYDDRRPFLPWMYTIAKNTMFDHLRKRRLVLFTELNSPNDEDQVSYEESLADTKVESVEVLLDQMKVKQLFDEFLDELPRERALIVTLHLEDGLTFNEIAEVTKTPMNTVKSSYRRVLIDMREKLEKHAPNYHLST